MKVIEIKTGIVDRSRRELVLKVLDYMPDRIQLRVEDEDNCQWLFTFRNYQALAVTSEECAIELIEELPIEGIFFFVEDSHWIRSLNECEHVKDSHHYILCCYDEVVEVIAWHYSVEKLCKQ